MEWAGGGGGGGTIVWGVLLTICLVRYKPARAANDKNINGQAILWSSKGKQSVQGVYLKIDGLNNNVNNSIM